MECRRKFSRTAVNFPVMYEVVKWTESPHEPQKAQVATSDDLSVRGIRFVHSLDLPDKTIKKLREGALRVNLKFTLPEENEPINILGRVIYYDEDEDTSLKKQCTGVLFLDISPEVFSKIDGFIQQRTDS